MGKLEITIKKALQKKILKHYQNRSDVIILNEFEILNGLSRIDIAVLNKYFHGYEIKSDKDNLLRLPEQVDNYNKIFDKMTLIVGYNHFYEAINIIPDWWGVKLYTEGPRGAIYFNEARREKRNPSNSEYYMAQLLLKTEMLEIVHSIGENKYLRNKHILGNSIITELTINQLRSKIKQYIQIRKNY